MTSNSSAHSTTTQSLAPTTVRGGNILISQQEWLKKIFGNSGTVDSKMRMLEKATRRQLGGILLIAFNLCNNKQSTLPEAHKVLLRKYDKQLQHAFFHIKSAEELRQVLLTRGLLPALVVTLRTKLNQSPVALAIRKILSDKK